MIPKEKFMQFVSTYHDRYGDWSMGPETMKMWYDKLKHLPWEEFKSCYQELIGAHPKAFGWKAVFVVHKAMFPPEDPNLAMDKEYRKNWNQGDKEKQAELSKIMAGYTSAIERAKKRGVALSFDWVKEYAHKTIEIFGRKEAVKICSEMLNSGYTGKEMYEFCDEVNNLGGRLV